MSEIEKLKKRVRDLERALNVFAEAAEEADEYGLDDSTQAPVDCADCRHAREVLDGA